MAEFPSEKLILLPSVEGQQMLRDVHEEGRYYQPFLHGVFAKQIGRRNCGITSIAMLMSAAKAAQDHPSTPVDIGSKFNPSISEARMFEFEETLNVANQETVDKLGLTLDGVVAILRGHGRTVDKRHASDIGVDEFRKQVKDTLESQNSKKGVNLNYLMSDMGQGEGFGGHHSPIVAYHEKSDRFLILDTWPETVEFWARADDIYHAMNTVDGQSGETRGFCISDF